MANELDELNGVVNPEGRDVNVIEKQIPVKVGFGSTIFEIILWVLGIIPGIIFLFMKIAFINSCNSPCFNIKLFSNVFI